MQTTPSHLTELRPFDGRGSWTDISQDTVTLGRPKTHFYLHNLSTEKCKEKVSNSPEIKQNVNLSLSYHLGLQVDSLCHNSCLVFRVRFKTVLVFKILRFFSAWKVPDWKFISASASEWNYFILNSNQLGFSFSCGEYSPQETDRNLDKGHTFTVVISCFFDFVLLK